MIVKVLYDFGNVDDLNPSNNKLTVQEQNVINGMCESVLYVSNLQNIFTLFVFISVSYLKILSTHNIFHFLKGQGTICNCGY
jgi:hypothetical protein